jgi:predicted PurR-regulated permease PerM
VTRANMPGLALKCGVAAAAFILASYFMWGLRSLIVPTAVGGLLAYICRPIVARLERGAIPRALAVVLLVLVFGLIALVGVNAVRAAIPSDIAFLELRVRTLYALNQRYSGLMGLDSSWNGAIVSTI